MNRIAHSPLLFTIGLVLSATSAAQVPAPAPAPAPMVRGSGKSAKYDSPQEVLSNEWRDLPPGDHRLAFTVGAEARPSFGGATIAVAHRVVVVPHGNTNPRRPALEHHIVVIR